MLTLPKTGFGWVVIPFLVVVVLFWVVIPSGLLLSFSGLLFLLVVVVLFWVVVLGCCPSVVVLCPLVVVVSGLLSLGCCPFLGCCPLVVVLSVVVLFIQRGFLGLGFSLKSGRRPLGFRSVRNSLLLSPSAQE